MLQDLNFPLLADRRIQARSGLMYRITGHLLPAIPPPPQTKPNQTKTKLNKTKKPKPTTNKQKTKTTWPMCMLAVDGYDSPSTRTLRSQTQSNFMWSEILPASNHLSLTQNNTNTPSLYTQWLTGTIWRRTYTSSKQTLPLSQSRLCIHISPEQVNITCSLCVCVCVCVCVRARVF